MRGPWLTPTSQHEWRGRSSSRAALLTVAIAIVCVVALPPAGSAAVPCWQRVIVDWSRDGRVDHTYPPACYRQAVKRLPEDLRAYSSAPDDIDRALTERRSADSRLRIATPVQPVAATEPQGARSPMIVIIPGLAGLIAAAGLVVWLLRARTS
jgi:hypothetical protein